MRTDKKVSHNVGQRTSAKLATNQNMFSYIATIVVHMQTSYVIANIAVVAS